MRCYRGIGPNECGWKPGCLSPAPKPCELFPQQEIKNAWNVSGAAENSAVGVYYASDSTLAVLDSVQARFLRAVGLSEVEALCNFSFAPLKIRRDIAILGMLHRVNLGQTS